MLASSLVFVLVIQFGYGEYKIEQDRNITESFAEVLNISNRFEERQISVEIFDKILSKFLNGKNNKDDILSIDALLLKYNQPVESHYVKTKDGYILKMFRIPSNGTAVFLMHGLFSSADDFVTAGPASGLAYLLAGAGYDVWMGNARGNKHSRKNDHISTSDSQFWNFSWHEIGIYDLPAMIDCVLEKTGRTTLKYIGHSQGTTSFFVLASERPEYNKKISQMIAMSPVAFMSNIKSPLIRLVASSNPLNQLFIKQMGSYEFYPDNTFTTASKKILCQGFGTLSELLCTNVVFLYVGFDIGQLNVTNLPVLLGHFPSGASVKQMQHYGQGINSGRFAKYDYGAYENRKIYGSRVSPEYDLGKITAPVYLFYSDNDWLADPVDVEKLSKQLGHFAEMYKIPYKKFNHLDFLFARDVKSLVYDKVLSVLKN